MTICYVEPYRCITESHLSFPFITLSAEGGLIGVLSELSGWICQTYIYKCCEQACSNNIMVGTSSLKDVLIYQALVAFACFSSRL